MFWTNTSMAAMFGNSKTNNSQGQGKGGGLPGPKGKGKGKPSFLMLEDKDLGNKNKNAESVENIPKEEETLIEEVIVKVRRAMAFVSKEELAIDEVLVVVKKSKYCNKALTTELTGHKKTLGDIFQTAKKALLNKNKSLDALKSLLVNMAGVCKAAQANMKQAKDLCKEKDSDQVTIASKGSKAKVKK